MENYFWNTEEGGRKKQVYVLVIYDIIKNKTRNKFAKVLQGYGFRVQKSAFEAIIDEKLFDQLVKEIPTLINSSEDTVRVYKIRGVGEVRLFGNSKAIKTEETIIL